MVARRIRGPGLAGPLPYRATGYSDYGTVRRTVTVSESPAAGGTVTRTSAASGDRPAPRVGPAAAHAGSDRIIPPQWHSLSPESRRVPRSRVLRFNAQAQ
eukprot:311028-Hanusia_phi.AAC.1